MAFDEFSVQLSGQEPTWLTQVREEAWERFERQGFPTTDQEDWKYTNVAPVARGKFRPISGENKSIDELINLDAYADQESLQSRLVFINGICSRELSSLQALPAGVVVTDLATALQGEHAHTLREKLALKVDGNEDGFQSLNTAFLRDGAFLLIPQGVKVETPILLLFLTTKSETLSSPRVIVIAERESAATLIETYAA
ncbi:MAG: Fe-S cluster assembly protein SufD, partial [Acidobacteria bacterium]|nr:Fe-S cluster assembly protein SufD [Acidobacteriota bacterium]